MPAEVALLGYAMPFARDTRYDSLLRLCPIIKMLRIFSLSLSISLSLYRYRYRYTVYRVYQLGVYPEFSIEKLGIRNFQHFSPVLYII